MRYFIKLLAVLLSFSYSSVNAEVIRLVCSFKDNSDYVYVFDTEGRTVNDERPSGEPLNVSETSISWGIKRKSTWPGYDEVNSFSIDRFTGGVDIVNELKKEGRLEDRKYLSGKCKKAPDKAQF